MRDGETSFGPFVLTLNRKLNGAVEADEAFSGAPETGGGDPTANEPPRGKPRGILSVVLVGAEARSDAEVYNIVWFNTKSL
jgi:hypothetical protein